MSPRWSRLSLPLRYAWRNAWAHRGATAVTIFGVAISVMVYVVMGATADSLKGILGVSDRPLVSTDFRGDERSAIVDAPSTIVVDNRIVKFVAWYDNEWGYACRLADLAVYTATADHAAGIAEPELAEVLDEPIEEPEEELAIPEL